MAFEIYSKTGSDLTYSREAENFSRMMRKGVYSGMQVYRGASGFDVSINAGYFSIAGRLIRSTIVQTNAITVPSPSGDDHHLIWVDASDPDNVSFEIKSGGSFTSPVALSPAEEADGLVLADIWVPWGASDISDCIIVNRDLVDINSRGFDANWTASKFVVSENAGDTRVTYTGVTLNVITKDAESRKSGVFYLYGTDVVVDDTSTNNAKYTVICLRSDSGFSDTNDPIKLSIIHMDDDPETGSDAYNAELVGNDDGGFSGATNKDAYPYRPNLDGLYVLAVHDKILNVVRYNGYGTVPEGKGIVNGVLNNVVNEVTSTAYGTTAEGNSIDIDDVITNMSTLRNASLGDAYNSMGIGSNGSGRVVDINRQPIELRHTNYDGFYTSYDNWMAAFRVKMDADDDGIVDAGPVAMDVYTNNIAKGERALLLRRPATISGNTCFNDNVTLIDASTRVEVSAIGGISTTNFLNELGLAAGTTSKSYILEVEEDLAGRASGAIFSLGFDVANDVFYLIDIDTGLDVDPSDLSSTVFPKTCTGTATLWDVHVNVGFDGAKFKSLEVTNSITGPSGRGAKINAVNLEVSRYAACKSSTHGETVITKTSNGRGAYTQVCTTALYGANSGNHRMYSDGSVVVTASFTSGNPISVKMWNGEGGLITSFSTSGNATSNNVGYLSCIRDEDSIVIAVPVGRVMEYFVVDPINNDYYSAGSINYGNGSSDECRVCVPVGYDKFWVGGSYSSFSAVHNMELHNITSSSVVQVFRLGKNSNISLFGGGLKFNGGNLVGLGIHSVTPASGTVAALNLNGDGQIAQEGSGSSFAQSQSTFYKNSWVDHIVEPLKVTATDEDVIVYGYDASGFGVIERYPMFKQFGLLSTTPLTITATPTHYLKLDVDPALGNLTAGSTVFDTTDDNDLVLMANDIALAGGTNTYSLTYILKGSDLNIRWGKLMARSASTGVVFTGNGCVDGASAFALLDNGAGLASIYRIDLSNGSRLGYVCGKDAGSLAKRSVVYGNKH